MNPKTIIQEIFEDDEMNETFRCLTETSETRKQQVYDTNMQLQEAKQAMIDLSGKIDQKVSMINWRHIQAQECNKDENDILTDSKSNLCMKCGIYKKWSHNDDQSNYGKSGQNVKVSFEANMRSLGQSCGEGFGKQETNER